MRNGWRRGRTVAALCCGLLSAALAVAGCAAPQFTYVADSSAHTYFKVPYGWHKVDDTLLMVQLSGLTSNFAANSSLWEAGYSPNRAPAASDAFNPFLSQPFVLAMVVPLNTSAKDVMSYTVLRNLLLPVTSGARQAAAAAGFPLTGFKLLADTTMTAGQGVHGVREIYSYTFSGAFNNTFDQVALTNANSTVAYVLLVHCLSTCYLQNFNVINTVMSSFTVRSQ